MIKPILLTLALIFMTGCGATIKSVAPTQEVTMDPIVIRKPNPRRTLDFYDAKEVFDRGRLARAFEKFDKCVHFFSIVINEFATSKYALPAHYNRGLCYENLQDPHSAAADFETYTRRAMQPSDRLDGQFRLLHNLVEVEYNIKALHLANQLLMLDLTELDTAEILTKKAKVLARLGQTEATKPLLRRAIRLAKSGTDGMVNGNSVLAESELLFGDLLSDEMRSIELSLPLDKMQVSLGKKLSLFRKSQAHLLSAVRTQVRVYSATAGEHLGQLYAGLYSDLINAERPADLNSIETKVYLEELILKVTPVLRNAITIFEKSIELGKRMGEDKRWLENVHTQKDKLQNLLRSVENKPSSKEN